MRYLIATAAACCALSPAWAGLYAVGGRAPYYSFDATYGTDTSAAGYLYTQMSGIDVLKLTATSTALPRLEIYPKTNTSESPNVDPTVTTGRRWYAFSVYVPSVNGSNLSQKLGAADVSLARIDLAPTQGPAQSPLAIKVENNELVLRLNFKHSVNAALASRRIVLDEEFKYDQWHCFIINANWHTNPGPTSDAPTDPSLNIIWNGKTVYEAHHWYNTQPNQALLPKTGFRFNGGTVPSNFTMYSDFIFVGYDDGSTLTQLQQRTPCTD